jgi:guanylate kinase
MNSGKIIVISAPSGCGKSTIIGSILDAGDIDMHFSVSATNRKPREGEENGVHYHFLTTEQFNDAIAENEFVEWEEVYPGRYYGTLKSELNNALSNDRNIILDIDVKGAINVKKLYGDKALLLFIAPPSVEVLRQRLINRGTDSMEVIDERVSKAAYELSFSDQFDTTVTNDDLDKAVAETRDIIVKFLAK